MAHYTDPSAPLSVTEAGKIQPLAVCIAVAGLVALLGAGLFFFRTKAVEDANGKTEAVIASQNNQLASLDTTVKRLEYFDTTAQGLHSVLDSQKHWDTVLTGFQSTLYKRMKVTSLDISDSGVFSLTGTTPSYRDYAKVFSALTNEHAKKYLGTLRVVSVTKNPAKDATDITFSFQGTLTPAALVGTVAQ